MGRAWFWVCISKFMIDFIKEETLSFSPLALVWHAQDCQDKAARGTLVAGNWHFDRERERKREKER